MSYPFTAGENLLATEADLMSELLRKDFTVGEDIDASSIPIAVYMKNSDGKVWKADSDADESAFKFVGFVGGGQNLSAEDTAVITTGGVLEGFTGLTINTFYFLSETAGAITATAPNDRNVEVAMAVSATSILVLTPNRKFAQTTDTLAQASGSGSRTITCGFRPRIIQMVLTVSANDDGGSKRSGMWTWVEGTNALSMRSYGAFSMEYNVFTNWVPEGYSDLNLSIGSVTDTGFDIDYTRDASWTSGYVMRLAIWG